MPLVAAPGARTGLARLMRAAWPDWYGPGGQGEAGADLLDRSREAGLPWGVAALEGDVAVGTAALAATSHGAEPGEGPWLVGLVVAPARRGRGIGSALVAACEAQARAEGRAERGARGRGRAGERPRLLATTEAARALLLRRGWTEVRHLADGHAVLALDL